jgi:hypothetical protein
MKHNQINLPQNRPVIHRQLFNENDDDPYLLSQKLVDPSVCTDCGALYQNGAWHWKKTLSSDATKIRCAACKRILENMPAGFVTIDGPFALKIRREILSQINHLEAREKREHPLKRIIEIAESAKEMVITTTDIQLAKAIGEALKRAYKGKLILHLPKDKYNIRVHWTR